MKILALETSGKSGSVAALTADRVVYDQTLPSDQRSAQALAPALVACLSEVGWNPADVNLLVVTTGPGSFTGLRVGVTTAKMFAYVAGCEALGVDTLRVTATQLNVRGRDICAIMDAQRQQVFSGRYRVDSDGRIHTLQPTAIFSRDEWLATITPETIVTGTGLDASRGALLERLPEQAEMANRSIWAPRAGSVGRLGWADYQDGRRDDIWNLLPQYFRKSAAEEKRERQAAVDRQPVAGS